MLTAENGRKITAAGRTGRFYEYRLIYRYTGSSWQVWYYSKAFLNRYFIIPWSSAISLKSISALCVSCSIYIFVLYFGNNNVQFWFQLHIFKPDETTPIIIRPTISANKQSVHYIAFIWLQGHWVVRFKNLHVIFIPKPWSIWPCEEWTGTNGYSLRYIVICAFL